jgi:hypothetical protein
VSGAASVEALDDSVRRLADRLRSLGAPRLGRAPTSPPPGGAADVRSVADQAHALAGELAALDVGAARRSEATQPVVPVVPRLSDFAVGDQVAVCGASCLASVREVPSETLVWWSGQRLPLGPLVARLTQRARDLRLAV